MNECIGAVIAVDCGADGYYQGKLAKLDLVGDSRGIVLSNAFREGMPCGKMLRLDVSKIQSVKVLKTAEAGAPAAIELPETPRKPAIKSAASNKNPVTNKTNFSIPETPNKGKSLKWVIRPLKNETSGKDYSTSSDIESHSSIENKPKIQKKKVKPSQRPKEVQAAAVQTVESTPTPMFKRYEPQVPKPQSLSVPAWAVKSVKKGHGPCGIPILDVQNGYGPISRRNAYLDNPIDFEELSQDFDFHSNLNMFDKDNVETDDEDFYEAVEKPKMSQNFRHDQNILSDPSRITSWTAVTAKNCYSADEMPSSSAPKPSELRAPRQAAFCPSSFEKVSNGSKVPSLNESIKSKYLASSVAHLTPPGYSSIVADRLLSYSFEIIKTSQLPKVLTVVVLSHSTVSEMAASLAAGLTNRGHRAHVYGEAKDSGGIRRPPNSKNLPPRPHLIVSLHKETVLALVPYLDNNRNSHILSLESRPPIADFSKTHILMLGVFTEGLSSVPATLAVGKTTFAALCGAVSTAAPIDYRVADIGVPFSWIVDGGAEALADAFATATLIRP